jgi:hypothetical protein
MNGDNFRYPASEDVAVMCEQYAMREDTPPEVRWVLMVAARLIRRLSERTIVLARRNEQAEAKA